LTHPTISRFNTSNFELYVIVLPLHVFSIFFVVIRLEYFCYQYFIYYGSQYTVHPSIHPSNGATAQIGPWPPLLRLHNKNVLRCEAVNLTTNPR
jgi:hypothetical protein